MKYAQVERQILYAPSFAFNSIIRIQDVVYQAHLHPGLDRRRDRPDRVECNRGSRHEQCFHCKLKISLLGN